MLNTMAKVTNTQEPEQLLLAFDEECFGAVPAHYSRTHRHMASERPSIPEFLTAIRSNALTLQEFLAQIGISVITFFDGWRKKSAVVTVNRLVMDDDANGRSLVVSRNREENHGENVSYCATLAYFDETGRLWRTDLKFCFDQNPFFNRYGNPCHSIYCIEYALGEWSTPKTTKLMPGLHFLQNTNERWSILDKNRPYTAKWGLEVGADPECLLLAPHIEILCKAGFSFANQFRFYRLLNEDACTIFNRLCQQGNKPKDIFKTCKVVYSVLKRESDLEIWDSYRKLHKLGKIGSDTIQQAYDQGYRRKDLEYINSILAKRYNGKPVFSWNSLLQYLVRLDTFEAIPRQEAFGLLNDYLSMCGQLNMEPRINGDSLKREHDIAARNCRNRKDEIMAERMQANCETMKKYDYAEGVYFVRGIRSHADLLDEANQQHNCVASYAAQIATGKSFIYVMREVANPEKSLVTIELSPNGRSIRQKYLAYNQPIRNRSQSEFLDRWLKHIKTMS